MLSAAVCKRVLGLVMRWIAVAAACVFFGLSGPARAALLVDIDKSRQQLTVTIDGTKTYSWPVSTGRAGYDTPGGAFRAYRLEPDWYSSKFDDAPMPHSVFFHEGYAVHGTLEASKLGSAASHGCVRLSRENAQVLFELVKKHGLKNTRVAVSGIATVANMRMPEPRHASAPKAKKLTKKQTKKNQKVAAHSDRPQKFNQRSGSRERVGAHEQRMQKKYREAGFRW